MRVITHCPACQTQFFATEEQLNKHGGKVRCGHCLRAFDAKAQIVDITEHKNTPPNTEPTAPDIADSESPTLTKSANHTRSQKDKTKSTLDLHPAQPSYLDDISGKSKLSPKLASNNLERWLWAAACFLAIVAAVLQSIYFMRNEIALYYPQLKPFLVQSCQMLNCKIALPEQIELIMIDDSDMQEDSKHADLIYFSSTLINTGSHSVAFPNLELTLTDVDDNPLVRRLFNPAEYLPKDINLDLGFVAGAEIKIKLPITTSETTVSGYRVFVTY
jgi:predicted Zn finger-like uncharacterized protein